MKTKFIKSPVANELITIEYAFESYEISNIGKDESLKDAFESGWNARLNQFVEVPDREQEIKGMLEKIVNIQYHSKLPLSSLNSAVREARELLNTLK